MKEEEKRELLKHFAEWYGTAKNISSIMTNPDTCINEYINSLKPKLEVGKWYKEKGGSIAFYQGDNVETYGMNDVGTWRSNACWFHDWNLEDDEWTLATDKEVEEALVTEAKRRGYKDGVKVKKVIDGNLGENDWVIPFNYKITFNEYGLFFSNIGIFNSVKGQWAEIIEEQLEVTLEEIAEKFGIPVEQIKIKK